MAQFAPVDNLVVKSVQEQYPPTSSLADQQECVDAIEGNVIQTSQKVTDLDKKIAETVKNNRDIEARLDQMENEIERMNAGIDSINKVTDNIKAADELITEADSITQNLITEMDELEDISSDDFKIPEIKERIEEYNTFDFEDANGKVKLARERARDLRNKLVELRNLWSIADENCEVVDSGQVSCELPIDSTVYAQMLYKIQHMVNEAKVNEQTANDGLKDLISQSNGYAQCKLPDSNPPVDFVAQKNTFDKLERELEDLNLEVLQETPNPNWDRIDKIYNDVNKLYQEIREVLYGPDATDEDISSDPKNWDKIYGLDGAINFLSNPACWRLGEECDFPTGDVASQDPVTQKANDDWLKKYKGIIESTIQAAQDGMNVPGVDNQIGDITTVIDELKAGMEETEKAQDELDALTKDINHLIASSRSLIDRIPLERNGQNLGKSQWIKPHMPDDPSAFGDDVLYSFEATINVKLNEPVGGNNVLFFGEADNRVAIDTDDAGHAIASFRSNGQTYHVISDDVIPFGSADWYQIKFSKNGRRIGVTVKNLNGLPAGADDDNDDDFEVGERKDTNARKRRRKRKRHTKRTTLNSRIRRELETVPIKSADFIPYRDAAWQLKIGSGKTRK